ncbi:MAG: response regulator transcription factor [Lachnospiraceae bacterium]|nr:response regulator transcription factor [Lachnospiraceae bacterium]
MNCGDDMISVLVIEDDKTINDLLCSIIKKSGYMADRASNGLDGLHKALSGNYNIILMDLMLPLKTGEEVLKELRKAKNTPVIIISAKAEVYNRIELFQIGADDYITKPFDIDEVMLRIQAVLRRTETQKSDFLLFRDIKLDTDSKRVYVKDTEITCTATEYAILELMLKNPKGIFSKRRLYESISGETYLSDDNTMNVHISNLRKKIAKITSEEYIETVYGMGYRLTN